MAFFFDTSVLIEMIKGEPRQQELWQEAIVTGLLNLGEIYSVLYRLHNRHTALYWCRKLEEKILTFDSFLLYDAMELRSKERKRGLSYVDCVTYALARHFNLILLTRDNGFRGLPGVRILA